MPKLTSMLRDAALVAGFILTTGLSNATAEEDPPSNWIDSQTGHRVLRLSERAGSMSLYFHQHPFSADGKQMVITTSRGIEAVDLESKKVRLLVKDTAQVLVTGRKTGDIYYVLGDAVHAVSFNTGKSRKVADLPLEHRWPDEMLRQVSANERSRRNAENVDPAEAPLREPAGPLRRNRHWGNITINANESLIVGIGYDPEGKTVPRQPPEGDSLEGRLGRAWVSGVPRVIYTIDLASGAKRVIHHSNEWLNHLQCSPTDPEQILFCHEGPWQYVDRTWLIRTDGSGLTQVHERTIDMEIAGHEFFSSDGKTVWYDLQTPRSMVFWLAGYEIATGKRTWYHVNRKEWSVHYNISPDGKLFSGDGGGPSSVANLDANFHRLEPPQNGQWMYLFRPHLTTKTGRRTQADSLVQTGVFRAEKLVDLSSHDYELEPNGIFTPDGRWLVFRSNMHGEPHVYAVEVERADKVASSEAATIRD